MAAKLLGLGTVTKVDEDGNTTGHTTVTLTVELTPPERSRALIDASTLGDSLATYAAGIEEHSSYTFTQYWEPGDTQHESLDTLFVSRNAVQWQIVYTSTPAKTDTFTGFISSLAPQAITINGLVTRVVTIQRTGAITRA
jgi:hypothetical protein